MSSFRQMYCHITFGTHERRPVLLAERREELLQYGWGVVKDLKGKLYRINAVEDHLHMFVAIPPTVTVSNFIKEFKVSTSLWIKASGVVPGFGHWQEGYGIFTHSHSEKNRLIEYVKNQQEHHRKETFQEEFRQLLMEAGIEFREEWLI